MKSHFALFGAALLSAPFLSAHAQSTAVPVVNVDPATTAAPAAEANTPAVADSSVAANTPVAKPDGARHGGVGLKFGLDGFGLNYVYGINRFVGVRAGYNTGSYSYDDDKDGTTYKAKLKLNAVSGFIDIMPFGGGFRLSAGLYSKTPELTLHAHGVDQYEFGDGKYNGDLTVDGKTNLGNASPYLGLGWGGTANDTGFGMSFDLGAIFGKSPKLDLKASGFACDASADASCDPHGANGFDVSKDKQFQDNLNTERQKLEDDAKSFHIWPVINFGLFYRF